MINLELLYFGSFREITGTSRSGAVIDDGSRLSDLIEHLSAEYGTAFGELVSGIEGLRILVNGREYYLLGKMDAELADSDTVVFLPPIAGG